MSGAQNGTVWADGRLRDWSTLSVPLMSDAVVRSVAVFDGLRADLTEDGRIRMLAGRAHVRRLIRSARALRLPVAYGVEDILLACAEVARAELEGTGYTVGYVRPMVLAAALTEQAKESSLTIAAFGRAASIPAPVRLQVSALRRPAPDSVPPQVKAVANYQLSRLSRLAAHAAGYDDALLLNQHGRLAESAGAAVLMECDGRLITPPAWEGCLPSITVDVLDRLAGVLGIPFAREPVLLNSIWSADGLALAGTLADLVQVQTVDDLGVPAGPELAALRTAYAAALDTADADPRHVEQLAFAEFPAS